MTDDAKNEIAALRAELDRLKPTEIDDAAMRKWQSDMHELRERRAAGFNPFSRADIAAMRAACPDQVMRDIALRDARAPTGRPGMIPSSQQPPNVRGPMIPPGGGTGWQAPTPLTPPPGIAWVDAILEVESAKQRGERMVVEAKIKAAEKSE